MRARITLEAEKLLSTFNEEKRKAVIEEASKRSKLIDVDLINAVLSDINFEEKKEFIGKIEVRKSHFHPEAKEYSSNIEIKHGEDVTNKSRSQGKVKDFVAYFRNRFHSFRSLFRSSIRDYDEISIEDIRKGESLNKVKVYCMVYDIGKSRNGNTVLTIEDTTGFAKAVVGRDSNIEDKISILTRDDVVMLYGKVVRGLFIIEDLDYPDVPLAEFPLVEKDVSILYLSDTHFGSRYFMENVFERFVKWLNGNYGNTREKKLAGKVKYIAIAGDIVDGIGIYPGQEKELIVKDIFKQYELFDEFVSKVPDYIDILVIPGNHDAVRRAEPMPAISKEIIKSDVILAGNPTTAVIEGIKHILYHGTSMDSMISNIPKLTYEDPKEVMATYVRKRHLSPIYGENPIVPEKIDYLLMRTLPNVLHTGHVHTYARGVYRNVALINSATFQDQTEYQLKQGHVPTPGVIPMLELKSSQMHLFDFKQENVLLH